MSYILDALRKSELERRPAGTRSQVLRDPGPAMLPPRRIAMIALPIVGALALAAGAYLMLVRSTGDTAAPAATVVDAIPTLAPVPKAPETPPAPPPTKVVAAAPPAPKPAPPPVRDLVEQTRVAPQPASRVIETQPLTAAVPAADAPRTRSADDVKLLRVMPPEFQRALPEMVVNIHVYAVPEAERILYINNRQYHAGDKVRDDVVVEEIVEDGAVLSFRGQRFKLPRPS